MYTSECTAILLQGVNKRQEPRNSWDLRS